MHFLQAISTAAVLGLASAAPANPRDYSDPTGDGFPDPSAAQLAAIEAMADGQISNAPPPSTLAASSLTAFQLIAFNENFEVGFFSSLIDNITNGVDGYTLDAVAQAELLSVLKTVRAVSRPTEFADSGHPASPARAHADSAHSKKSSTPSAPKQS